MRFECSVCCDPAVALVEARRRWRWKDDEAGRRWNGDEADRLLDGWFACAHCLQREMQRWARGPWRLRVVRYLTTEVVR